MEDKDLDKSRVSVTEVFDFLRFPLIVMVVTFHTFQTSHYEEATSCWYSNLMYFMWRTTAGMRVPVFFVISGYMLLGNVERYTHIVYFSKLKRRMRTLLVPYIIWNALSLVILMVKKLPIFASILPNIHKVVVDPIFCLESFWALPDGGAPLYYPFWYIRDLMVMVVLSPIIYWVLKKIKVLWLLGLFALMFCDVEGVNGLDVSSMLYFSIGAYWAMCKRNTLPSVRLLGVVALLWLPIACMDTITRESHWHTLSVVSGIGVTLFIGTMAVCKYKHKANKALMKSVFFIYAIHATFVEVIYKSFERLFPPHNGVELFVFATAMTIIVLMVSFIVYRLFARYLPEVCRIMCGGRK